VQEDRMAHVNVTIFANDPHPGAGRLGGIEHRGAGVVQLADEPGHVAAGGSESLWVVIEVRHVQERQLGALVLDDLGGASSDPLRAGKSGTGAPKRVEWELSQRALEPVAQSFGCAGDAEDLVAVAAIMGFRGDADIDGSPLVEPPKKLSCTKWTPALD